MKPSQSEIYERYLTSFSCSATGSVAHPAVITEADGPPERREVMEAAQAIGVRDGLRYRHAPNAETNLTSRKALLKEIDILLGESCTTHAWYCSPGGELRVYVEGVTAATTATMVRQDLENMVARLLDPESMMARLF